MSQVRQTNSLCTYQSAPYSIQNAINACNTAHTGLHQAIGKLKSGSVIQAKSLISHFYYSFG